MPILDRDTHHWSSRPLLIAGIGIVAVAVAVGLNAGRGPDEAQPPSTIPGETATAAGPILPSDAVPPTPPLTFDIARIGPTGDTVIAGRAAPGATVTIRSNDEPIGEATADHRGEWVFVPDAPLSPGAHRLTLETRQPQGAPNVGSGEVLIIVPAEGPDATHQEAPPRPLALLLSDRRGAATTVLQASRETGTATGVQVDAVDYDAGGRLAVAGRGTPESRVHVLIDGRIIGESLVDASGHWTLSPRKLSLSGTHTLRAEEADPAGRIISHFDGQLRLAPPETAATDAQGTVVVERGDNLWHIAREQYGEGYSYTIIFEANRDRISNPDMIFPGQSFRLPPPDRHPTTP
jgi:Uncharacterized protein containing LysM domain